jgi:hypothetical protein
MNKVACRQRNQPAPPWAVFDDLSDPHRQPLRPWLVLNADEIAPTVVDSSRPVFLVWSSLWIQRPDASVHFDLTAARGGTDLRWTLYVEDPIPDVGVVRHLRQRIDELINANLRHTYGQ